MLMLYDIDSFHFYWRNACRNIIVDIIPRARFFFSSFFPLSLFFSFSKLKIHFHSRFVFKRFFFSHATDAAPFGDYWVVLNFFFFPPFFCGDFFLLFFLLFFSLTKVTFWEMDVRHSWKNKAMKLFHWNSSDFIIYFFFVNKIDYFTFI